MPRGRERGLAQPFRLSRQSSGRSVMTETRRALTSDGALARDRGGVVSSSNRRNNGGDCRDDDAGAGALCAKGSGRRAAPAASTAAATARAAEEESPSAGGRVRPQRRVEPLALFSAGDLHRDRDTYRGGVLRVTTGPEPARRPLSPPPPSLLPARILSPLCLPPRGSWCACTLQCGPRGRTCGLGVGGRGL